jgi:hypothetical protein
VGPEVNMGSGKDEEPESLNGEQAAGPKGTEWDPLNGREKVREWMRTPSTVGEVDFEAADLRREIERHIIRVGAEHRAILRRQLLLGFSPSADAIQLAKERGIALEATPEDFRASAEGLDRWRRMLADAPKRARVRANRYPALRVKLESLVAESKIIRRHERMAVPDMRAKLSEHRRREVRSEARAAGLAIAFLRGIPYGRVEPSTSLTDRQFMQLLGRVEKLVRRYGSRFYPYPKDPEAIAQREATIRFEDTALAFWLEQALACYKERVTGK